MPVLNTRPHVLNKESMFIHTNSRPTIQELFVTTVGSNSFPVVVDVVVLMEKVGDHCLPL